MGDFLGAEVSGRDKGKVRRGVEDAAPYDKGKEDMRRPEDWPPYESSRQTLITRSTGTRTPTRS